MSASNRGDEAHVGVVPPEAAASTCLMGGLALFCPHCPSLCMDALAHTQPVTVHDFGLTLLLICPSIPFSSGPRLAGVHTAAVSCLQPSAYEEEGETEIVADLL